MWIQDFVRNFRFSPSFSWRKNVSDSATLSKVKQRNESGTNYAAGRDLHIHTAGEQSKRLPFAYFQGAVGCNGARMLVVGAKVINLSEKAIFAERIEVIGMTFPLRSRLVGPVHT